MARRSPRKNSSNKINACGAGIGVIGHSHLMLMRIAKLILIFCSVAGLSACRATQNVQVNDHPTALNQLAWENARNSSFKAEAEGDKPLRAKLAQEGVAYAEECIMEEPEQAECYYYRAINTGIYYSAHVVGYQDGLKNMIKDCEKVISLNDKLDHGGAYRTLGKIYTDVPETFLARNGVRKDLEKSISYLQKAVQVDSAYPENHIYLAEAYFEAGKKKEAFAELVAAQGLTPQWKNHRDYSMWQKMNKELSGKIK